MAWDLVIHLLSRALMAHSRRNDDPGLTTTFSNRTSDSSSCVFFLDLETEAQSFSAEVNCVDWRDYSA
jgi:hypothetical protein